MLPSEILNQSKPTALAVVELLKVFGNESERSEFNQLLRKQLPFLFKPDNRAGLMNLGFFEVDGFELVLDVFAKSRNIVGANPNTLVVETTLELMKKHVFITRVPMSQPPRYQVVVERILDYERAGLIEFILFGVPHMLGKLAASIPAINVKNSEGDIHAGTGILVYSEFESDIIITNRHVLENNELIDVKAGPYNYMVKSQPEFCDFADLAAIEVTAPPAAQALWFFEDPIVLTEAIAFGYPNIPGTDDQYALAHKGEVNGTVHTRTGEQFIAISCHVSPGNSGGPILSTIGYCLGMVTQSNSAEYRSLTGADKGHTSIYNMAIPPSIIRKFLGNLDYKKALPFV